MGFYLSTAMVMEDDGDERFSIFYWVGFGPSAGGVR